MNAAEIGLNVATLRRKAGLSQAALAQRAGTTQAVISRIENGRVMPGSDLLDRIAVAAGRPLELAFGAQAAPIPRSERRARARQALGDFVFDPWDREPAPAEARSLIADGLSRERFARD